MLPPFLDWDWLTLIRLRAHNRCGADQKNNLFDNTQSWSVTSDDKHIANDAIVRFTTNDRADRSLL